MHSPLDGINTRVFNKLTVRYVLYLLLTGSFMCTVFKRATTWDYIPITHTLQLRNWVIIIILGDIYIYLCVYIYVRIYIQFYKNISICLPFSIWGNQGFNKPVSDKVPRISLPTEVWCWQPGRHINKPGCIDNTHFHHPKYPNMPLSLATWKCVTSSGQLGTRINSHQPSQVQPRWEGL